MIGGRTRARTWDPLIKSQLLYQLSYAPETVGKPPRRAVRTLVAEELAELLLMPGDAVFFDECNEVGGCVARQRGLAEVGIRGYEVARVRVEIGEVAAAAARNSNLLADSVRML